MRRGLGVKAIRATSLLAGLALLASAGLAFAASGQISIDVRLVAVSTRDLGIAQIWSFSVDGSDGRALTTGPAAHYSPKVSPDGTHIAFTGEDGGGYSIYSMNVDGSGVVRLTRPPLSAGTPAWSADGTLIAFTGSQGGGRGYQIWTMKADGTGQKQLTSQPDSNNSSPAFAPGGAEIAFTNSATPVGGSTVSRIYTVNADGSAAAPVTAGPGDGFAAWLDSTGFLFARAASDGKSSQVFLQTVGGAETAASPAGAFFTEPQPGADGKRYVATGRAAGAALGLFWLALDGGTSPGAGTPIAIPGGGDTYSPVLIAAAQAPLPSPSGGGAAPPGGGVVTTGGFDISLWEVLVGVGIFVVVIGAVTYYVKLRPKKDNCDKERAAALAAEAEWEAAKAGLDAAEAVHNKALAVRHNADAQVNWVSDQPPGPSVEQATAAQAAAVVAAAEAYKTLVDAGNRQGGARINLDVARKRLYDCEALNGLIQDALENPPPTQQPALSEAESREVQRQIDNPMSTLGDLLRTDPKTGKLWPPVAHVDTADDHDEPEPVDPNLTHIYEGPGFDPVPPSPPPEVKPPVDDREIG